MKLHLPKELLAAVLFCVSAAGTTYAATYTPGSEVSLPNVININFAGDWASIVENSDEASLPYGENSFDYGFSAWTTVSNATGTATVTDLLGNQYTLEWSSPNTWRSGVDTNTLVGTITKGYLDITQGSSESKASFTLSTIGTGNTNLDWKQVNIILSGDEKGAFAKVQVGNTDYFYNNAGKLTSLTPDAPEQNPTWGMRAGSTTLTEGVNLMCVTNETGATESSLTVTGKGNGVDRATIAGVQIVLNGSTSKTVISTGTISGLVENETVSASGLGLETFYSGKFTVEVTATEVADDVAQLTLDQDLRVGTLNVTGGALRLDVGTGKNFSGSIELGSNASLALGGTGVASVNSLSLGSGSGKLTLEEGVGVTIGAIRLGSDTTLTLGGTGVASANIQTLYSDGGKLTLEEGVGVTIGAKLASNFAAKTFNAEKGSTLSIAGNYTSPADFQAALNSFTGTGTLKFADAQTDVQPNEKPFNVAVTGKKVVFDQGLAFNGTSKTDKPQTFTVGEGAEITVNNRALEARRLNVNVDKGGTLTANAGILIGHSEGGDYDGWVNLSGGKIVTTSIKGQNNNGTGDSLTPLTPLSALSAFTMTDGTLTITGTEAFGLTADTKKLVLKLQGGTIQAGASQTGTSTMNLAETAYAKSSNLVFEIGKVTFDTGTGNTINLNHDFTQKGTLTVTGSGTLNFSGAVTLDDVTRLEVDGNATYSDGNNGYLNASYIVVKGSGTSATVTGLDQVTLNGSTYTLAESEGNRVVTLNGTGGTYYVNDDKNTVGKDTVVYGGTGENTNNAASDETTGIILNGGNLTLAKNLNSNVQTGPDKTGTGIVVQQAATVTINKGVTLAQGNLTANAATELKVNGTFEVTDIDLGQNISFVNTSTGTLSAKWTGRALSDAAISNRAKDFRGAVVVESGASWLIGDGYEFSSVTVESGGQFGLDGTYKGNITISGTGVSDSTDADQKNGALKFGPGGTLNGNVTISGSKAALSTWGTHAGTIKGNISFTTGEDISSTTQNYAELELLNGDTGKVHTADNTITVGGTVEGNQVGGNLSGINKVTTTAASMTVTGTIENFGDTFTKSGAGTLALSKAEAITGGTVIVEGGTLKVTGSIGKTSSVAVSGDGVLEISGSDASVTARANSANPGTAKKVTIGASLIAGTTTTKEDDTTLQELGEMSSMTLAFAAANTAVNVNNVTMQDVTLATNGTVTYGDNVKAVAASTRDAAVSPVLYAAEQPSETPKTLTAMAVLEGGTTSGTLTIDVTKDLLKESFGKNLEWTFFVGVSLAEGEAFTLKLGDVLKEIVGNGKPTVTLSGDWVNNDGTNTVDLTSANWDSLSTNSQISGNLLAAPVGDAGGNLVLTIENVPEPTTGTLSVLALAALAARRRRRE